MCSLGLCFCRFCPASLNLFQTAQAKLACPSIQQQMAMSNMLWLLCMQQQQQQQWVPPQSPVYAAQSASHSGSWSQQQPPHQRQQLQQQQLNSQQIAKAELQSLVLQLTPQQREHLSKMPHDKRMHFFHNLRNQMARAQQQQQQQLQLQQQMGQQGSWQQPSGLQQTGAGPMQQPGPSSLPQVCSDSNAESIGVAVLHSFLYTAPSCSAVDTLPPASASSPVGS